MMEMNYRYVVCSWTRRQKRQSSLLLFLLGTFCRTQIVLLGVIGISEIPMFVLAPIVFWRDRARLRETGFIKIIYMAGLLMFIIPISCLVNGNFYFYPVLKHEAVIYSIIAYIVCFHRLLRGNLAGVRWFLLGVTISLVIKTFAFNPTLEVGASGYVVTDAENLSSFGSPLYWTAILTTAGRAILGGWYDVIPGWLAIGYALPAAAYVLSNTESGRSGMACFLLALCIRFLGGKRYLTLKKFVRHSALVGLCACAVGALLFKGYSYVAKNGYLGQKALSKYEIQSRHGEGVIRMLMTGRVEFFIALRAALDKPLLGHGVVPWDNKGYYREYVNRFGDADELAYYDSQHEKQGTAAIDLIPQHSLIAGWWMTYGVIGLFFWLYVLFLIIQYFRKYAVASPRIFGVCPFFAVNFVWDIFFSGYGTRYIMPLTLVLILFARAAYKGWYTSDPEDMGLTWR